MSAVSVSVGSYVVAVGSSGVISRKTTANVWGLHADTGGITTNTLNEVSCRSSGNAVNCLAVGTAGTILSYASTNVTLNDGNWTTTFVGGANAYQGVVTYFDASSVPHAVVVGNGVARILTNTTWGSEVALAGSPNLNGTGSHTLGNGQVIACGAAGTVRFSTNHGSSWAAFDPPGFAGTTFYGSAFTWQQLVQQTNQSLRGVATVSSAPARAYVVGNVGTVLFTDYSGE